MTRVMEMLNNGKIQLFNSDAMFMYEQWESPIVIISDGPYGVGGYKGDLVPVVTLESGMSHT